MTSPELKTCFFGGIQNIKIFGHYPDGECIIIILLHFNVTKYNFPRANNAPSKPQIEVIILFT